MTEVNPHTWDRMLGALAVVEAWTEGDRADAVKLAELVGKKELAAGFVSLIITLRGELAKAKGWTVEEVNQALRNAILERQANAA